MDDGSPLYGVILYVIFIMINGLMYAFGEADRKINESEIEKKAEAGDKKSIKIKKINDKPDKFINTVHLITCVTVAIIGYYQVKSYGITCRNWLVEVVGNVFIDEVIYVIAYLFVAIYFMFLIISLGIVVPKRLGSKYSEKCVRTLIGPVSFITWILTPFTKLISLFSGIVLWIFGIDQNEALLNVTEEEIISMVNEGHEQGVLEEREAEMISNIMELDEKTADEIMVHRKNIIAVDGTWTLEKTVEFIIKQNYSRFPVYIDSIDNIIGILHLRNAMAHYYNKCDNQKQLVSIEGIMIQPKFIPESRNVDDAFKDMQLNKNHMEIVVDEYGQTSGLIAMEDILEEIVGNIFDEYDIEENNIVIESDGVYLIKGMTTLEEMEDILDEEFNDEDYDTLNGYLISKLDRIPLDDERPELIIDKYKYQVLLVKNKMISLVRVTKLTKNDEYLNNNLNIEEVYN